MRRRDRLAAWVTLCLVSSHPAVAHEPGATRVAVAFLADGSYRVDVQLDALSALQRLELDAGKGFSKAMPAAELEARLEARRAELRSRFLLYADAQLLEPALTIAVEPPVSAGAAYAGTLELTGPLPRAVTALTFYNALASRRMAVTVERPGEDALETHWVDAGERSPPLLVTAPKVSRLAVVRQYVPLGFTHILPLGSDHILFVLGIFLLAARARPILVQVTAFTVAHTITLGLSTYGVVALPSRVVEPLIALSIVAVAIENVFQPRVTPWRVAIVFGFGLLHGLGFAGALQALGLPRGELLTALVSFNVGVELGQLAVVLAAYLAVASWSRDRPWYRRRVVVPGSVLIAAIGLYWTVERLLA